MKLKELDEKIRKKFNLSERAGWLIRDTGEIVELERSYGDFIGGEEGERGRLGFLEDLD